MNNLSNRLPAKITSQRQCIALMAKLMAMSSLHRVLHELMADSMLYNHVLRMFFLSNCLHHKSSEMFIMS